jgi:circadian clock protein KaiC
VKVRASDHSKDLRLFEITGDGIVVGERVADYQGLLTGSPHQASSNGQEPGRGRSGGRRPRPRS